MPLENRDNVPVPPISRIRSAARSGASAAHHTIDAYLDEHIDSDYALVTVERADGHFTLVIDAAYLELACAAERENPALVEGLTNGGTLS